MTSELKHHIDTISVMDTHEHLAKEDGWINEGSKDVLIDLFQNYAIADLITAGASRQSVEQLTDTNISLEDRWAGLEQAWQALRFTGYGEAVRLLARQIYDIDELNADAMIAAQPKLDALRQPGERLRLLRDVAMIDHVQIDDFRAPCPPDPSGPDFFLYDLSMVSFCNGNTNFDKVEQLTSINVTSIDALDNAMQALFEQFAPTAIAVKSQHAYCRTLAWHRREKASAEVALQDLLKGKAHDETASRLCLGDWCWARVVELCIEHDLPFKIHCGYYAGNDKMPVDRISAGHLCPLLAQYLDAKFVLMHIAYPYCDELISIAKHYPNVWVDLCWAWSINPMTSTDFVRRFLHAAPVNKLLGFGGDTFTPTSAVAYCMQMRKWLYRAMQAEVDQGDLTEQEAIEVVTRLLRGNQTDLFDLESTRANIQQAAVATA